MAKVKLVFQHVRLPHSAAGRNVYGMMDNDVHAYNKRFPNGFDEMHAKGYLLGCASRWKKLISDADEDINAKAGPYRYLTSGLALLLSDEVEPDTATLAFTDPKEDACKVVVEAMPEEEAAHG